MQIELTLKSDTTFGCGDGLAGLIDSEVEHEGETGLPYLKARTLKGLLVEECASILYALEKQGSKAKDDLNQAAKFLFGESGALAEGGAQAQFGSARLPHELRVAVSYAVHRSNNNEGGAINAADILDSLTSIRRQTAVNEETGCPEKGSLRSMRVVLRDTVFIAHISFLEDIPSTVLALLAACTMALRRAGSGRNRGRGKLGARLLDKEGRDVTLRHFQSFEALVGGARK